MQALTDAYHFLFETSIGLACLMGAGIVVSIVVALVLERRMRKRYPDESAQQ